MKLVGQPHAALTAAARSELRPAGQLGRQLGKQAGKPRPS